jgi:ferredoxin
MKSKFLKYARVVCAVVMMLSIVTLFCDTTGIARHYLGWTVDIQFLPSISAGLIATFVSTLVVTKLFGRIYCSVICPLGIFQDIVARLGRLTKKQKVKYSYSEEKLWMRLIIAVLFIASYLLCAYPIVGLLEPYSIFGRMATTLLAPVGRFIAEYLAASSEAAGDYTFAMPTALNYSYVMLGVALFSLVLIAILAFRGGRTYCNTICPVGTILSIFAENSVMKPVVDHDKCVKCGLCAKKCKASCIDAKNGIVDSSRCVDCMNCISVCHKGAISFSTSSDKDKTPNIIKRIKEHFGKKAKKDENAPVATDESKRAFLTVGTLVVGSAMTKSMAKTFDGGLAEITEKKEPQRNDRITPPGSKSYKHIEEVCTSCGLCITACPNEVLRPSESLDSLLTPVMSFEKGYCRPECKRCSDVCPTGAISLADLAEKSATHVGHAVLIADNCISMKKGVSCGNCARHCPAGAITMAPTVNGDETSPKMPVIDSQRCIGCGACEHLCPSSPYSAIYVEGHRVHRID